MIFPLSPFVLSQFLPGEKPSPHLPSSPPHYPPLGHRAAAAVQKRRVDTFTDAPLLFIRLYILPSHVCSTSFRLSSSFEGWRGAFKGIAYSAPFVECGILLLLTSHFLWGRRVKLFSLGLYDKCLVKKNNQTNFKMPRCSLKTTRLNWLLFFFPVCAVLSCLSPVCTPLSYSWSFSLLMKAGSRTDLRVRVFTHTA